MDYFQNFSGCSGARRSLLRPVDEEPPVNGNSVGWGVFVTPARDHLQLVRKHSVGEAQTADVISAPGELGESSGGHRRLIGVVRPPTVHAFVDS